MNEADHHRRLASVRPASVLQGAEQYGLVQEIDLRAVFGFFSRQWRLIAVSVLVIVALTALWTFSLTPKYTAENLVLVESSQRNLLDPQNALSNAPVDSSRVESAVEIVRSTSTLLRVIQDERLIGDQEFGVSLGFRAWLTGLLRSTEVKVPSGADALKLVRENFDRALSVRRLGLTDVLSIAVESTDPDRAAELANAVASAYIDDQVDAKISAALAARDILQRRIAAATEAVTQAEEAIDGFVFKNVDRIAEEGGRPEIIDFRDEIARLEADRVGTDRLAALVTARLQQRDWASLLDTLESDAFRVLETQRQAIEARLVRLGDAEPASFDLRAELARLEAELENVAITKLSSLRRNLNEAKGRISDIRSDIRGAALAADLPTDLLTAFYGLQQESSIARNQYQVLLSRLRDVEAQADLQLADARVVSPAVAPRAPSSPRVLLILTVAGLFSLSLGTGLAWLRENYIGGFTSEQQLEAVLNVSVAASVPKLRGAGATAQGKSPADALFKAPLSLYSESIRRVRTKIDQAASAIRSDRGASGQGTVVMVSSAVPGEGKSTLALSLARAFAISGSSTIAIDCDLRRPSMHKHVGVSPKPGLQDHLAGRDSTKAISDLVVHDAQTGLALIMGARESTTPTDQLVMGAAFAGLIESASANYDIVVLDTPPIGAVVDALYLARHADVVALVVQWASSGQDEVRSALRSLTESKRPGTDVVAILNGVESGFGSYDRRYAGYYDG